MSIRTEFLFMIADTKPGDDKILMELEKSVDGDNVAFIYNSSTPASTCNVRFSFTPSIVYNGHAITDKYIVHFTGYISEVV